jgi:hypothetical protein
VGTGGTPGSLGGISFGDLGGGSSRARPGTVEGFERGFAGSGVFGSTGGPGFIGKRSLFLFSAQLPDRRGVPHRRNRPGSGLLLA